MKSAETHKFIDDAFYNGTLKTTGTDIDKLMPRMSRFGGGQRDIKKKDIIEKLSSFFEKYFGLGHEIAQSDR